MSVPPADSADPNPVNTVNLDARSLRGLAHPLRLRLLRALRDGGPSTSTQLAGRLGVSSGATSYHLRQLAAYGFIAEDQALGSGRERWWRALHQRINYRSEDFGPDAAELSEVFLRAAVAMQDEELQRAIDEWATLPLAWRRASRLSELPLRLTPDELSRMNDELSAVIDRYRQDDPELATQAPPGSAPIMVQVRAFRRPGAAAGGERVR